MFKFLQNIDRKGSKARYGGLDIFRYIGPGLLVTVGFSIPETGRRTLLPALITVTPHNLFLHSEIIQSRQLKHIVYQILWILLLILFAQAVI